MPENLRVQKRIVGVHVANDDMQQVIAFAGDRKALGDLGQQRDVSFEVVPVFIRMLGHCDREQHLNLKPGLVRIEQHFVEMEWLTPREPETYLEAANLYRQLRSQGRTIRSTIDCIIAKLAEENDGTFRQPNK